MNAIFTVADVLTPVVRALRLSAADDITLAIGRIDVWHRELCGMTDWPALRAVQTVASAAGASVTIADGAGVSAVFAYVGGAPYWFCERQDVDASDMAERRLWSIGMPGRDTNGGLVIDVWDWSTTATPAAHVLSTGTALKVAYWKRPAALTVATDKLALPETRALLVRVVIDMMVLLDRKATEAAPWQQEMDTSLAELLKCNPVAPALSLRLVSGRVLTRGPSR